MKKRKILKIVLGALLFIAIAVGLAFLINDLLEPIKQSFADKTWLPLANRFKDYGIYALLAIGFLQAIFIVIPVIPATPLQIIAAVVLDPLLAFLVIIIGVFAGNVIMFFIVRKLGPTVDKFYTKKDPDKLEQLQSIDDVGVLSKRVVYLYFFPIISYGLIAFTCAKSKMKFPKYILLTTLGTIPSIVVALLLGNLVADPLMFVILLAALVILSIIMFKYSKNIQKIFKKRPKKDMHFFQTNVREPSKFLYFLFVKILYKIVRRKVNLQVKNKEIFNDVEGPFVMIINHPSMIDWIYTFPHLYPKKANPVMAFYYFTNYRFGKYLHKIGGFPKFLYQPDISSIKNIKKVINAGGIISIAPEGRLSAYGELETIAPATEKLLKHLKVPVYYGKINGGYLTLPKWTKKIRKGRVDVSFEQVFTAEELAEQSLEEIRLNLETKFYYNDFEWQKENRVTFKGKRLAEGLENILYLCPTCKSEFTLKTKKNKITCSNCSLDVTLNNHYEFKSSDFLVPANIRDWFLLQKEYEKEKVANPNYELKEKVTLKLPDPKGRGFKIVGGGTCRFTHEGLFYKGTINDVIIDKLFKIQNIPAIPFGANVNFEAYHDGTLYYFVPKSPQHSVKWSVVGEALYNKYLEGNPENE